MSWIVTPQQRALLASAQDWSTSERICAEAGYDGRGRHGGASYSIQMLNNYGLLDWDPRKNLFRCTAKGLAAVRAYDDLQRQKQRRIERRRAEQRAIANA